MRSPHSKWDCNRGVDPTFAYFNCIPATSETTALPKKPTTKEAITTDSCPSFCKAVDNPCVRNSCKECFLCKGEMTNSSPTSLPGNAMLSDVALALQVCSRPLQGNVHFSAILLPTLVVEILTFAKTVRIAQKVTQLCIAVTDVPTPPCVLLRTFLHTNGDTL